MLADEGEDEDEDKNEDKDDAMGSETRKENGRIKFVARRPWKKDLLMSSIAKRRDKVTASSGIGSVERVTTISMAFLFEGDVRATHRKPSMTSPAHGMPLL